MLNSSKNRILQKLRAGIGRKTSMPFPKTTHANGIFPDISADADLDIYFAEQLTAVGGKFVFCENWDEMMVQLNDICIEQGWKYLYCWDKDLQGLFQDYDFRLCRIGHNLEKADASVTLCECLIAQTGSIIMTSKQTEGRELAIIPPVHIVIAGIQQILPNMEQALGSIKEKYGQQMPSMIDIITGASFTTIANERQYGAAGSVGLYVFLMENL